MILSYFAGGVLEQGDMQFPKDDVRRVNLLKGRKTTNQTLLLLIRAVVSWSSQSIKIINE